MYVLYICICGSMTMAFTGKFTFWFVLKHSYAIMKTMYMIYIPPVLLYRDFSNLYCVSLLTFDCFNLFILHNNSFDNQRSQINKNDIFLRFDMETHNIALDVYTLRNIIIMITE